MENNINKIPCLSFCMFCFFFFRFLLWNLSQRHRCSFLPTLKRERLMRGLSGVFDFCLLGPIPSHGNVEESISYTWIMRFCFFFFNLSFLFCIFFGGKSSGRLGQGTIFIFFSYFLPWRICVFFFFYFIDILIDFYLQRQKMYLDKFKSFFSLKKR